MHLRHRLFVLTDIENEPDDTQSLVRLLLYSNEIDIEGLVAVTSTWLRTKVGPDSIHDVIDGYAAVRDKLLRISADFPAAEDLHGVVAAGIVKYGMAGVGENCDSPGSELLIRAVDRADAEGRPLHVALWGGANCLAQALWRVRKDRTPSDFSTFISHVRVYAISDQDDAGPWIRRNFPSIPFVVSIHGENVYMGATWIWFASNRLDGLPGATKNLISKDWLNKNIQIGPLGSKYPDVIYGMEGDTPSYLHCIPNGLNHPEYPDFGGWGGRYKKIFDLEAEHYHDACDKVVSLEDGTEQFGAAATIWRWRDAVQNDFASRMRWTLEDDKSLIELPPVVVVDGDDGSTFVERQAKVSETLEFDASASCSPQGSPLRFRWFQYKEIGSVFPFPTEVPDFDMHGTANAPRLKVTMPEQTEHQANDRMEHVQGRVFHIILEVTSDGTFPLTRYRRIMIDVRP